MIHTLFYFFVLSVVIYLLYKLYTYTRQRAAIWFGKREVPDAITDVSYTAEHGSKGSTVNINIHNSNDSLHSTDAAPQPPKRSLRPRVANSYF